jgi:hypothetical protein
VHGKLVIKIKLITVHRTTTYPVFWRQVVQNSNHSPDTKKQFVDVALSAQKNVDAVRYIRWLSYTSSPTDHIELIILTFDMFNLCDRRLHEGDNNKYKNNNNINNNNNKNKNDKQLYFTGEITLM